MEKWKWRRSKRGTSWFSGSRKEVNVEKEVELEGKWEVGKQREK
jgi:hypothetical protein